MDDFEVDYDAEEIRRHADLLPDTRLTVCRLRVGHDELRGRIARRGSLLHLTEENLRNAAELDHTGFADLVVDTEGLTVAEVAALVRDASWPGRVPPREVSMLPPPDAPHTNTVPVLWLCGPPAVGKSTVGYENFTRVLGDGVPAAYIDLAQIGFCRPAPDDDPDHHRLKAHHLARVWARFRAAGAAEAAQIADALDHASIGNLWVDTDGREVAELADLVRAEAAGWSSRALSASQAPGLQPVPAPEDARDPRFIEGPR